MRNQDKKNPSSSMVQGPASSVEASEDQSGATLWNNPQTRRRFLRRSGAAAVGTILAMEGLRLEVSAQTSSGDAGPEIRIKSASHSISATLDTALITVPFAYREVLRSNMSLGPGTTWWRDEVTFEFYARAQIIKQIWVPTGAFTGFFMDDPTPPSPILAQTPEVQKETSFVNTGGGVIENTGSSGTGFDSVVYDGKFLKIRIILPESVPVSCGIKAEYGSDDVEIDCNYELDTRG